MASHQGKPADPPSPRGTTRIRSNLVLGTLRVMAQGGFMNRPNPSSSMWCWADQLHSTYGCAHFSFAPGGSVGLDNRFSASANRGSFHGAQVVFSLRTTRRIRFERGRCGIWAQMCVFVHKCTCQAFGTKTRQSKHLRIPSDTNSQVLRSIPFPKDV